MRAGSTIATAYRGLATTERYCCDSGLNPDHLGDLTAGGLVVSGADRRSGI